MTSLARVLPPLNTYARAIDAMLQRRSSFMACMPIALDSQETSSPRDYSYLSRGGTFCDIEPWPVFYLPYLRQHIRFSHKCTLCFRETGVSRPADSRRCPSNLLSATRDYSYPESPTLSLSRTF
eukprot:scaffold333952_cov18-Prasinocladus_malaysianus.AAC.2